jgi:hypothetical protein
MRIAEAERPFLKSPLFSGIINREHAGVNMTGEKVEEELKMEYIPLWERDSYEEGIKIDVEKGVEGGIKECVKKKAMEMAKKFHEEDLSIEIISKLTALSK